MTECPGRSYANTRSRVRVVEGYNREFEEQVGVHEGSVLSPRLFIIVLEALSREFRSRVPWEDLYADDLVFIAVSLEESVRMLLIWKEAIEENGPRVNAGKMKIIIFGTGLVPLQSSTSSHALSVALDWAATAYSVKSVSPGCTRNTIGSSA